jgi:hypothetical protein
MLDSHPLLAVGYDCHFIPQAIRRVAVGTDPTLTPELVERVRSSPRYARLGLPDDVPDKAAATARTYSEFVSVLYSEFGRLHGKPLAGEKAPGYCRHLPKLHALFPWARFIHLIRDGRDIALSVLDWGKGPAKLELSREEPVAACALWWRRDVTSGLRDGRSLDPARYREVRYEALVARPEETLQDVASFLELPYVEEMVTFHEGKTSYKPGRSAKASWLPPTQGLRDWRTQMPERDRELFEALAGDVLATLGYEPGAERISRHVNAVAERCRRWWEKNMPPRQPKADRRGNRAPRSAGNGRPPPPHAAASKVSLHRPTEMPASEEGKKRNQNPYVFIVGCPRSGTTLLKRMVDAHPQIAITPETHWIPRYFRKRIGLTREGLLTREFIPRLLEYYKFPNLRISPEDLEELMPPAESVHYADFVSAIFDLYGKRKQKHFVGDKTPGYVQDLPLLHDLWPAAKIVHLIRDGRDVCLSVLEWKRAYRITGRFRTWNEDPVSTTALWWERFVRLGRECGSGLGPSLYHEIRYESLVADPEDECAALCSFLNLPFDDGMIRFHEGHTRADPELSAKKSWRPLTSGIRDWRSQMAAEDAERFEAVAGELLEQLAYPRAFPHPRTEERERASTIRAEFKQDPRLEKRSVPECW